MKPKTLITCTSFGNTAHVASSPWGINININLRPMAEHELKEIMAKIYEVVKDDIKPYEVQKGKPCNYND